MSTLSQTIENILLSSLQRHGSSALGTMMQIEPPYPVTRGTATKIVGYFSLADVADDIARAAQTATE